MLITLTTVVMTGTSVATPFVVVDSFTLPLPFGTPLSFSPTVGLAASADHLYLTEAYLDRASFGDLFVIDAETGILEQQLDLTFMGPYPPGLDGLALVNDELYGLLSGPVPTIFVMDPATGNLNRSYHPLVGSLWNGLGGFGSRLFGTNDSGIIYELNPLDGAPLNMLIPGIPPAFGLAYSDAPMMGLFAGSLFTGDMIWKLNPDTGVIEDMFTLSMVGGAGAGEIAGLAAYDQDLYVVDVYNHVYHLAPIPEPSTFLFLGLGLIGAAALARKRS